MFRVKPTVQAIAKSSKVIFAPANKFGTYKTSTGLVGLAVDPNGRTTLQTISEQILQSVKRVPEGAQYRENVEKWFSYIKNVSHEKTDIKAIEDEIDLGQIEEVIEMAKDELELIDFYVENKGWELVNEAKREANDIAAAMADSIYFSSPEARASFKKPEAPKA